MIENYDRCITALNSTSNKCLRDECSIGTSSTNLTVDNKSEVIRKIICRYGRGCTHMHDACHRVKFWHPPMPALTAEQLRTHYVCNECGVATASLDKLQLHLQRKTAWSNKSLIGCRISCLVDFKEWHEGHVTQYHRSGKHYVEFRAIGEKRWLNMKKIVFYIVERPAYTSTTPGESKDEIFENCGLAPIEDKWMYCDDISLDYAFSQSVLFKVYGSTVQETGHKTKGHVCLTEDDKDNAKNNKGSLLYGELLPRGANKAFGDQHLGASDASVLFDLGMGAGKVAVQAFVQFRNLKYVYGVELSLGRYCLAEDAVLRMVRLLGSELFTVKIVQGQSITITERIISTDNLNTDDSDDEDEGLNIGVSDLSNLGEVDMDGNTMSGMYEKFACETKSEEINESATRFRSEEIKNGNVRSETDMKVPGLKPQRKRKGRVLKLEFGNMFDVKNIQSADIVMLETDIPADLQSDLCALLSKMKEGSRTLSYLDLRKTWCSSSFFPFRQLENNKNLSDRFPTSWSVQRGHHFYVWSKFYPAPSNGTNGSFLSHQMKALCPSILGDRCDSGLTPASVPFRIGSSHAPDDEQRKKIDTSANSLGMGDLQGRSSGASLRQDNGKTSIATGRCLPFSFSNSIRSLFSGSELAGRKNNYSIRSNGNNGNNLNGSGTSNSASIIIKGPQGQRDDKNNTDGRDGTSGEGGGNRPSSLLGVKANTPAIRRVSEDSDKVIPLNTDGTRIFSSEPVNAMGSPHSETTARRTSSTRQIPPNDPWSDPSAAGPNLAPRSKVSVMEPYSAASHINSSSYEKNEGVNIEVASYIGTGERAKASKEGLKGSDREVDVEQSWYTLGYAIERMSFPLGNTDIASRNNCVDEEIDIDSESDSAESTDGMLLDDVDYRTSSGHGGLFLDKSSSHALADRGTWSTSVMRGPDAEDDAYQTLRLSHDMGSSSTDGTYPPKSSHACKTKSQQSPSTLFKGTYDPKGPDTGSFTDHRGGGGGGGVGVMGGDKSTALPAVDSNRNKVNNSTVKGPLLAARGQGTGSGSGLGSGSGGARQPPVTAPVDRQQQGSSGVTRGHKNAPESLRNGKTAPQEGSGCTLN